MWIRERIETIQKARLARILRRVQETWEDLLLLKTRLKDHQLKLAWRTYKESSNK